MARSNTQLSTAATLLSHGGWTQQDGPKPPATTLELIPADCGRPSRACVGWLASCMKPLQNCGSFHLTVMSQRGTGLFHRAHQAAAHYHDFERMRAHLSAGGGISAKQLCARACYWLTTT